MNNKHPKNTKPTTGRTKKSHKKTLNVFHCSMIAAVVVALGALGVVEYATARTTPDSLNPSLTLLQSLAALNIYALWVAGLVMFAVAVRTLGNEQGREGFLKPFGYVMKKVLVIMVLPAALLTALVIVVVNSL